MKVLTLQLRKEWFTMTKEEIKTEDYREINNYWAKRLIHNLSDVLLSKKRIIIKEFIDDIDAYKFLTNPRNNFGFKHFDTNRMTLGYPKATDKKRIVEFEHKGIEIGKGRKEWGAEEGKLYFIIKHGKRI